MQFFIESNDRNRKKKKKKEIKIKICTNHGILQQMFKKKIYARLNTLDCKKKKSKRFILHLYLLCQLANFFIETVLSSN